MGCAMVDFLARVHTLPEQLRGPLEHEHLEETKELYQFLIDSRLLWPIVSVDEHGYWVEVPRVDLNEEPHWHSLILDEGIYDRVETDPYEIDDERAAT